MVLNKWLKSLSTSQANKSHHRQLLRGFVSTSGSRRMWDNCFLIWKMKNVFSIVLFFSFPSFSLWLQKVRCLKKPQRNFYLIIHLVFRCIQAATDFKDNRRKLMGKVCWRARLNAPGLSKGAFPNYDLITFCLSCSVRLQSNLKTYLSVTCG